MEENKNILLKSAMSYGLAMGIYWIFKYIFFIIGYTRPAFMSVYWGCTLAVPFIAYVLTKRFREDLGGSIRFSQAWRFGVMIYFFAALIVSLAHYIFFKYIVSPDYLPSMIDSMTQILTSANVSPEAVKNLTQINITPIHMAIQGIFNNIFYGIVLSIPVAAIVQRNTGSTVNKQ